MINIVWIVIALFCPDGPFICHSLARNFNSYGFVDIRCYGNYEVLQYRVEIFPVYGSQCLLVNNLRGFIIMHFVVWFVAIVLERIPFGPIPFTWSSWLWPHALYWKTNIPTAAPLIVLKCIDLFWRHEYLLWNIYGVIIT